MSVLCQRALLTPGFSHLDEVGYPQLVVTNEMYMQNQSQIQQQIHALNSGNETLRREAIQALKLREAAEWESAPQDIIRSLVSALRHQLPRTMAAGVKPPLFRQEVAVILGNIGPRAAPALPELVELLTDGVPDGIREAVATAMGKIGKESRVGIDKLIHILNSNCRIALADRVARALGDIGCADQRVKTALVNLWLLPVHSQSNQVQVAIALCKLKIEARGLIKSLAGTLVANRDTSLRKSAAEALAWCSKNDLDVVPALTAALYDDDEDVRRLAEEGLTHLRLSQDKAIVMCAGQLKDSFCAEAALRKSGARAVPALIEALESKEPLAREKAARTLGAIGEPAIAAVAGLTAILDDKHIEVRLAAAKGLWNISKNADAVVPVLADLLGGKTYPQPETPDSRRSFIQSVIESLCRIGPAAKFAVPALKRKIKDENRLIRESATRALREISPAAAAGVAN
jgi:HEAT repeat protein